MRTVPRSALLLLVALASCGQVEPVILAVSMPDCTYQGPVRMKEGDARLSLTLNGLGNSRVLLAELEDGRTYDELETHFDESGEFESLPEWLHPVIDLELGAAQGVDGAADASHLRAGDYAVVCVDEDAGTVRAVSPMEVTGS